MEVLSDSTEVYDRKEKMEIYCKTGVSEYWIVDWRKRQVKKYLFDWKEDGTNYAYQAKQLRKKTRESCRSSCFPTCTFPLTSYLTSNSESDFRLLHKIIVNPYLFPPQPCPEGDHGGNGYGKSGRGGTVRYAANVETGRDHYIQHGFRHDSDSAHFQQAGGADRGGNPDAGKLQFDLL